VRSCRTPRQPGSQGHGCADGEWNSPPSVGRQVAGHPADQAEWEYNVGSGAQRYYSHAREATGQIPPASPELRDCVTCGTLVQWLALTTTTEVVPFCSVECEEEHYWGQRADREAETAGRNTWWSEHLVDEDVSDPGDWYVEPGGMECPNCERAPCECTDAMGEYAPG
jgi:hypothetical protein